MLSWEKLPQLIRDRKWHVPQEAEHNDSPLMSFIDVDSPCLHGNMVCVSGYSYKWGRFLCFVTTAPFLQSISQRRFLSAQWRNNDAIQERSKGIFEYNKYVFTYRFCWAIVQVQHLMITLNRLCKLFCSWQQWFVCKSYFYFGKTCF